MTPPGSRRSLRRRHARDEAAPRRRAPARRGSLTVAGTGIAGPAHTTPQALGAIRAAEQVFLLVADPLTREWLRELAPDAQSLADTYAIGRPRAESYEEMVERILAPVRGGQRVCALIYGHPGVFAAPPHEAVRRARAEGHEARMLPGISAEDCLFADLGVDPGRSGCQSYEATDFLLRPRRFDVATPLVLWQIGLIGVADVRATALWSIEGLRLLTEKLLESYPPDHPVVVYEAPTLPIEAAKAVSAPLAALPDAAVTALSTLFVAPRERRAIDPIVALRLGLEL